MVQKNLHVIVSVKRSLILVSYSAIIETWLRLAAAINPLSKVAIGSPFLMARSKRIEKLVVILSPGY